jgi:hypothetical protein
MTLHALAGLASLASFAARAPAAEDIRDIRAPIAIPEWWRWPLAIALSALAALGVILFVRWWKKRRMRELTPHQRALAALERATTLAREGRSHEWADVVAETIRAALSARLGHEVLPKTTSELARTAWAHWTYEGPVEHRDEPTEHTAQPDAPIVHDAPRIIELLQACDLARFAMARMDPAGLLQWTAFAREAVDHLFAPAPAAATETAPLTSQPVTST